MVVNYSSSKTGAEKVVDEIAGSGGKAIAVQANVSSRRTSNACLPRQRRHSANWTSWSTTRASMKSCPWRRSPRSTSTSSSISTCWACSSPRRRRPSNSAPDGRKHHQHQFHSQHSRRSGVAVYSGTKGAVDAITRSLAKELGPRRIRVNAINPGMVETEGTRSARHR